MLYMFDLIVVTEQQLYSGQEGIAGLQRTCQVEVTCGKCFCQTPDNKYSTNHARNVQSAVPDQLQEDQDVGGESSSSEATSAEACKRT